MTQLIFRAGAQANANMQAIAFVKNNLNLTVRVLLTLSLFMAALSLPSLPVNAGQLKDVPALIKVAQTPNYDRFAFMDHHPSLLGMGEIKSNDVSPFTKWTGMFKKFEEQLNNGSEKKTLNAFRDKLKPLLKFNDQDMIEQVNLMVNEIRYIEDRHNWGKTDYWATPAEFLKNGGDCEDFAITKYTALRALGVPENRLRIAIVQDLAKNIPHAVLVVYTNNGAVILDNQTNQIRPASDNIRYKAIFSINRHAWWLHKNEDGSFNGVVASAAQ